jgi:hypothetical protein
VDDLPNTEAEAIRDASKGCLLILVFLGCYGVVLYALYRLSIALLMF